MSASSLLMIFAKAPVIGYVNTRLVPDIGVEAATRLQTELIDLRMKQFGHTDKIDVQLWCSPDTHHDNFRRCADENDISLQQQDGTDLGTRMRHAFSLAFERYERAVLIGTDAPEIDHAWVKRALDALEDHDVVFVPAEDGGYVLIGMRSSYGDVFRSVPWGTSEVLRVTRQNIIAQKLTWRELETSWDIDCLDDYRRYCNYIKLEQD